MTVGATTVNVTDWTLTLTARLAENTPASSAGVATWAKIGEEGTGTVNAPWDSEQIPDTDLTTLTPGGEFSMSLYCGDSNKFFGFSAIVESLTMTCNTTNDIVRYSITFRTNGDITHPTT